MHFFCTREEIIAHNLKIGFPAEGGLDETGPPLTEAMIAEAEKTLWVKLPAFYLDLLRKQNGGYLKRSVVFDDIDDELRTIAGIGFENGIDVRGVMMSREWEYPSGLIWFSGDGHTGFFFDYRNGTTTEPPIVWLETEEHQLRLTSVAPSFNDFLRLIDEYVPSEE